MCYQGDIGGKVLVEMLLGMETQGQLVGECQKSWGNVVGWGK